MFSLLGFRCGTGWCGFRRGTGWCNILVFSDRPPSSQASFPPFTSSRGVSPFEDFWGIFIETNNQQQTSWSKPTSNILIETNKQHLYGHPNNFFRIKIQNPDEINSNALFQQFQKTVPTGEFQEFCRMKLSFKNKNFFSNKLTRKNSKALTTKTIFS